MAKRVFIGQIVHSKSIEEIEIFEKGYVAVDNGKIIAVGSDYSGWKEKNGHDYEEILLSTDQFLMPGLVDCHIHAPQMPNIGLGLDEPLMEWLTKYTFPVESKFKDTKYAQYIYNKVVETTIRCGTTLAVYFATIHKDSSLILAEEIVRQGQRAFVGKVSSDKNCPDYYLESTNEAIVEAEDFVLRVLEMKSDLVKPMITPRFAVSCSENLLKALGDLAKKYDLNIQSHISENLSEIELVKSTFKKSYADVYDDTGLLNSKSIYAHAVHLENEELLTFKRTGATVAHCPASNTNLNSGLSDIRRILGAGIKVGLGTDVSGGNSPSILHAILRCLDVSKHIKLAKIGPNTTEDIYIPLNYTNAFYLATLGGAEALAMDRVVGNFVVGKSFDALLVDTSCFPIFNSNEHLVNNSHTERISKLLERFLFTGDDRNIIRVYVNGRQVK